LKWGEEHPTIGELPEINLDEWRLIVDGDVENSLELMWHDFTGLEQVTSISDFHCVETWSVEDQKWEGVRFKTILDLVKPLKKAKYALFESYDGFTTSLPLSELGEENVLLAHRLNDEHLPQSLGGPMRLVVPDKYAYKSPMWLHKITFSPRDKLGYWERGAYSNKADPWKNDRYTIR
jgi:DMSO/TMAO reductase YedYZ molybdopterin-dependent catalytic subunit